MTILDFEVRKKFMEAISTGRYIVTISSVNKEKKCLDHYAVFNDYPTDDILPSLEHTTRLVLNQLPDWMNPVAKDNPKT